jgi:coiled-coil domain-containing protein 130
MRQRKYVPPELEGLKSGNSIHSKHALGARAAKSSQGILTVRFEMPFPIWCTSCPKPTIIGQGVRFNAEKKSIGKYYSTPIFSFRMKHIACGSWIEIRTDPKNTAYVVHEGARKRDTGDDIVRDGDVEVETVEEREARRADAFASFEGKKDDKVKLEAAKERLEELQDVQDLQWEDPYEQNRKLRNAFRVGRKAREREAGVTGKLQDKMSLGIALLPENEEDARRAGFVEFGIKDAEQAIKNAISKPMFDTEELLDAQSRKTKKKSGKLKAEQLAEKRRAELVAEVRGSVRGRTDPFLRDPGVARPGAKLELGIKRKRAEDEGRGSDHGTNSSENSRPTIKSLVDYDSD